MLKNGEIVVEEMDIATITVTNMRFSSRSYKGLACTHHGYENAIVVEGVIKGSPRAAEVG